MLRLPSASDLGTGLPLQLQSNHTNMWAPFLTSRVRKRCLTRSRKEFRMATGRARNVSSNTGVHRGNTCPETGFGLLVHLPHLWVFQGEHAEPLGILRQDRLRWIASHQGRHGCFAQNCNWVTQVSKQRTRCKAFFSLEKLECYTTWLLQNNLICNFHWN